MDKSTSKSVELVAFEPEEWSTMNQHQKIDSIWWDTDGAQLKNLAIEPYVNTEDDDDDVLLEKIKAAKFAFKHVFKKMNVARQAYVNYQRPDSEDEDEDHHSAPDYYGYTEEELLKFVSALRFNYPFELCFKVKADIKHEFEYCICSCSINNKRWREMFDIDCVRDHEKCKKKNNEKYTIDQILQHLQSKHNTGYCYFHSISYFYIMKLYSNIIPTHFLCDLPEEEIEVEEESKETTSTRKRKQDNNTIAPSDEAANLSRHTKVSRKTSSTISSFPPSSIECHGIIGKTDSSSISTVTNSLLPAASSSAKASSSNVLATAAAAASSSAIAADSNNILATAAASSVVAAASSVAAAASSVAAGSSNILATAAASSSVAAGSSNVLDAAAFASDPHPILGSRFARRSTFRITEANRTRREGSITILYHDNTLKNPERDPPKKTKKRNKTKNMKEQSHLRDLKDFVHTKRNKEAYSKKKFHVIDTSQPSTDDSPLGKLCYGFARCFGRNGRCYKPMRLGEPVHKFEWCIKLSNHPADLYMSNVQLKEIASRDGSQELPYFPLFIGIGEFESPR